MTEKTYDGDDRRRAPSATELQNMHNRMDTQDELLREVRDLLVGHLAADQQVKPAIEELIAMWKGSKMAFRIISVLAAAGAALWSLLVWAKDHVKL